MAEKMIKCPSCGVSFKESNWNENTKEIVFALTDDETFTPYSERVEGTAYRCPNEGCEDEVITDKYGIVRTQDDEGNPISSGELESIITDLKIAGTCYIPHTLTGEEWEALGIIIEKEFGYEYSTIDIEELIANEQERYGDIPTDMKCRLYLLDC